MKIFDPTEGDRQDVGSSMEIFARAVDRGYSHAQRVPVGFSDTVYQEYVKMSIRVTEQRDPTLTFDALGLLLAGNWSLYYMSQYTEHPFSFTVTNNAGASMLLTLDRMPVTKSLITAGNVDIHADLYRDNPLTPSRVQSVLNQAIQSCNERSGTPITDEFEGDFKSGEVLLLIHDYGPSIPPEYTYGALGEALQELNRRYRYTGQWMALWGWIGWKRDPRFVLSSIEIFIDYT